MSFVCLFVFIIYFWLCWVFVAARGLSLVAENGDYSLLRCTAPHCGGFSCCGAQALGVRASVVVAHGLSCFVACGIFPTRARTHVPCIGRQILNHCTTREALRMFLKLGKEMSQFELLIQENRVSRWSRQICLILEVATVTMLHSSKTSTTVSDQIYCDRHHY